MNNLSLRVYLTHGKNVYNTTSCSVPNNDLSLAHRLASIFLSRDDISKTQVALGWYDGMFHEYRYDHTQEGVTIRQHIPSNTGYPEYKQIDATLDYDPREQS